MRAVWTKLLKANDRVLLSLGTFVHVLSVLFLTVFLFQECRKKLLLLIDIPRDSQCQYLIKCVGDQRHWCATILIIMAL